MKISNIFIDKKSYSKKDIIKILTQIDNNNKPKIIITFHEEIIFQYNTNKKYQVKNIISEQKAIEKSNFHDLYKERKELLYKFFLTDEFSLIVITKSKIANNYLKPIQLISYNFLFSEILGNSLSHEYNNIVFIEKLNREIKRGQRYNLIFTMSVITVKHPSIKKNLSIVKKLNRIIRDSDFAGIHNNKPVLVLTNTDKEGVEHLFERIENFLDIKIIHRDYTFPFDGYLKQDIFSHLS